MQRVGRDDKKGALMGRWASENRNGSKRSLPKTLPTQRLRELFSVLCSEIKEIESGSELPAIRDDVFISL